VEEVYTKGQKAGGGVIVVGAFTTFNVFSVKSVFLRGGGGQFYSSLKSRHSAIDIAILEDELQL
jgi:hypothetical protein